MSIIDYVIVIVPMAILLRKTTVRSFQMTKNNKNPEFL